MVLVELLPTERQATPFQSGRDQECRCPNCGSQGLSIFYTLEGIPVHSCLLMPTRDEAVHYPKGNLRLGFCSSCGFVANTDFDPSVQEYSTRYEETQGFSPTFNRFAHELAQRWVDRYDLHDKDVLEIGCGKGEFLVHLCELGPNRGIGVDPSYVPERLTHPAAARVKFIQDFYSERYAHLTADFICCRHTLEHIAPTGAFLRMLRRAIGDRTNTIVCFELPDVVRILEEGAFWDLYYEHCSYFSPGSLARLFRASGFDVLELARAYADQYLLIGAKPVNTATAARLPLEDDLRQLADAVAAFPEICVGQIGKWRRCLQDLVARNQRVVVWGSGSKGVAFLTTLGLTSEIAYVVDINPYKLGQFMPGTGHEIVAPKFLADYRPDAVIVMNPIYSREIRRHLDALGLTTQILAV
jgi:SAM-dependent methyltransferase